MDMDMSMTTTTAAAAASATAMAMATSMSMSTFTTAFPTAPLLFPHLQPTTPAALFGVWLLIFTTAVLHRGLVCAKARLEASVWAADDDTQLTQPFSATRDGARGALELLTAAVGYALMLVAMSFVVVYFFAVVVGLAVGEVVFRRLEVGGGRGRGKGGHH